MITESGERIGWKELGFKEGQLIVCVRNREKDQPNSDFWEDRVIIGKSYKIVDLEWRFWDRVCIVTDYSNNSEFVPVELFYEDIAYKRDKKIDEILK